MTTSNTVNISEIPLDQNDATKTASGASLASQYYFVIANGTDAGETFDAADLSAGIRTLMATYGRGVAINMGGGGDTVTGSAYGDTITVGDGTNYVDGGDNQGAQPGGAPARDVLNVYAASQAAVDALSVAQIDASATGADADAYNHGYRIKVSNGAETDYLKNIEQVNVFVTAGSSYNFAKTINLAVDVTEASATQDVSSYMDLAWAHGTGFGDTFNASTDISSATRALMDQHQRGVWVETGAGDDTITGSAYGDDINAGSGTNYVDGGGNAGSPPWGGKAIDTLHVTVADQAAASAVQVVALADGMSGADADAYAQGYTHKVVAAGETDYIKDIERVSVQVDGGNGGSTWARDIPLAVVVQEANLSDPASANNYHLAWVTGTAGADSIDASAGGTLLSSAVQAAMAAGHHGVYIDGGAGNDTITGSAYADNFVNGPGNSKIDGGANAGPNGTHGMDMFQVTVASAAEMDAVTVSPSDDPDYQWMVTYGAGSTQKDYLKNVEALVISVDGTSTGKWIPLAVSVNEIQSSGDLANSLDYAWAQGTAGGDNFNAATDVSSATLALMDQHQRGVWVDLGAGNDTIVGSGYGDDINAGSGTNYVDGGANAGSLPWGGKAADTLHVTVATQAAAAAVQVVALADGMTGADADAYSRGYTYKVVAGAETDYIKDIERISVQVDTGNGSSAWARDIPLTVMVQEANLSDPHIANYYQLAWINGTANADTIDASAGSTLLSSAAQAAMASSQRGVWIDGGDGNDTITGSAYADNFRNGAGNDKIDGGANASASGHGMDVFEISLADSAALAALRVTPSDDPAYQWMVTYGAGSTQKDYLKNIEGISVAVADSNTYKWIPLAVTVNEASLSDPNLGSYADLAWVNGTAGNDTIDASAASPLLSGAIKAAMDAHQRGVYIDGGAGDDTMVGTAYGDEFVPGTGTNYVNGGDNRGSTPSNGSAMDTVDMFVASQAEADAVKVTALAQAMTGDDGAAWAAGYRYKVTNGSSEIDYLKNVETVNISIWNDKNGDGMRDYRGSSDPANEVTFVRSVSLAANTAPAFSGAPAGVAVNDAGLDSTPAGGIVLASGKMLEVIFQTNSVDAETMLVLTRTNADGSIDTSFGGGSGHVKVPASFNAVAPPLETADGKLLVAVSGFGSQSGFQVLRLNADGSLDTSFGTGGYSGDLVGASDRVYKLALDPSGKIVLVGGAMGPANMVVMRLNADGSHDTGFNGTGTLALSLAAGVNVAEDVAFTKDGKMIVAGFSGTSGATAQLALARINADGTLDSAFGTGGKATVAVSAGASHATAVQALDDGKVLVAGYFKDASTGSTDPVLVRLNADGSTDATFGTGGMVKGGSPGYIIDMQVQADGKILALGTLDMAGLELGTATTITRYNADGSLDSSFGDGGSVTMSVHGIGDNPASLALAGGKIVVFGASFNDTNYDASNVIMRLNADGSLDTSFGTANPSSLGGTVRMDGYHPTALDLNVSVYDAELAARGNYGGATLTLVRHGAAASLDDHFSGVGDVSIANGTLSVDGTAISTATQAGGKLTVTFNSAATQGMVNLAMHGIGYANANSAPPAQVAIDWSFSDGNDGSQGSGGAAATAGSTTVQIGMLVTEVAASQADPSLSSVHQPLVNVAYMGQVQGTLGADSFDSATGFSSTVHALMDTYQRGASFDMGPGADTVKGTAWADSFTMGSGTNHVDGGGNGTANRSDSLEIYASSQADADATQITSLQPGAVGADADAFAAGYTVKVVSGSETDYLKNVQRVDIWRWNDANGDQVRDASEVSFARSVQLALRVSETQVSSTDPTKDTYGNLLSKDYWFANVSGTMLDDSFSAATGLSTSARALMDTFKRGVYIDLGAGNDTVVGSAYGDTINAGQGVNHVDGGANDGTDPSGFAARDSLQVYVSTQAGGAGAASAVKLTSAMTGADAQAYSDGYTWKVAVPGETDYIKNIEQIDVYTWNDANGNGVRDVGETTSYGKQILLVPQIFETAVSSTDPAKDANGNPLANYSQFAWLTGSAGDDSINGAAGVSANTLALMDKYQRGMSFDLGTGDDVAVGTQYGDTFNGGAGTNKIDGGDNIGTDSNGYHMRDVLNVMVSSTSPAVNVVKLTGTMTGADHDAFAAGYTWKVSATGETDYLKNIEAVEVFTWNDANGNGQQDNGETTVKEILLVPSLSEVAVSATDPTKDAYGNALATNPTFAWVTGTSDGDVINGASGVSAATLALMDKYQHGMSFVTGAGDDVVTGTQYADWFNGGPGTNKIDGGDNIGTDSNGYQMRDVLNVIVSSTSPAVNVVKLAGTMTGADHDAFAAGYTWKVSATGETDYLKNIEAVDVFTWNDANGNGQQDNGETTVKEILLVPSLREVVVSATDPAKDAYGNALATGSQFAWVAGTSDGDVINGASGVSAATLALMDKYQGGMSFDTGAGDDVVTGTRYGDWFNVGPGTNKIDGGDNVGIDAYGGHMRDILTVQVTSQAPTVNVTQLGAASTGADHDAFAQGYAWKVSATGETDYVKNVEAVDVMTWNDANGNGQQDNGETTFNEIRLAPSINEIVVSATDPTKDSDGHDLSGHMDFASIEGTAGDDVLNTASLSAQTTALMAQYKIGAYIYSGAGNDVMTGTPYGDYFVSFGPGVKKIDGGANDGTSFFDHQKGAVDALEMYAANPDTVTVIQLTSGLAGADGAAYADGYRYKVANGSVETDYLKNVEVVHINGWNDTNHNGQIDYDINEVTIGRTVTMDGTNPPSSGNTAPTLKLSVFLNTDGVDPVPLDPQVEVHDAELAQRGYAGASLTLARELGASPDDVFGATGEVSFANGVLSVAGTAIGHVSSVGGTLTLHFEAGATEELANRALHGITYANQSSTASSAFPIDWTFSDGGDGSGAGTLTTAGSISVLFHTMTSEVTRSATDATLSTDGRKLVDIQSFGTVSGTAHAETVDSSAFSATARALMDEFHRGASFQSNGGGDTVTGTAYGDEITVGIGVNYVDGGANGGTDSLGNPAQDLLHITVTSQALADAIAVVTLGNSATGADLTAFNAGYTYKITAGNEIDYVKNVEMYDVNVWNDQNHDGHVDAGELTLIGSHHLGGSPTSVVPVGVPAAGV